MLVDFPRPAPDRQKRVPKLSTPFTRTLRSLRADTFAGSVVTLLVTTALLGAWLAWFVLTRVQRYEVTGTARLEVDRAIHAVQAPTAGSVLRSSLVLGRDVAPGDVLVELDAQPERLQMQEAQTRLGSLTAQIDSRKSEIAAAEEAAAREQQASELALNEAHSRVREADTIAKHLESELRRLEQLHGEGLIPARDLDQGRTAAESRRAAADSLRVVPERLQREQQTRAGDRDVRIKTLWGDIRRLEAEKTTIAATVDRLRYDTERRCIRAPVAGRLGEVATLRPGAVVEAGAKLGAILPAGGLRVIAEFAPAAAMGRIRAGQRGRMRLAGFPWIQYGSIPTVVSSVANEIRGGTVRVELSVGSGVRSPVPLQHGLPGSVEVEVEQLSPAMLVMRAAGRMIASPRSPFDR